LIERSSIKRSLAPLLSWQLLDIIVRSQHISLRRIWLPTNAKISLFRNKRKEYVTLIFSIGMPMRETKMIASAVLGKRLITKDPRVTVLTRLLSKRNQFILEDHQRSQLNKKLKWNSVIAYANKTSIVNLSNMILITQDFLKTASSSLSLATLVITTSKLFVLQSKVRVNNLQKQSQNPKSPKLKDKLPKNSQKPKNPKSKKKPKIMKRNLIKKKVQKVIKK